jgi:hypothetical protein
MKITDGVGCKGDGLVEAPQAGARLKFWVRDSPGRRRFLPENSDSLQLRHRALVDDVAGVERRGRLEKDDPAFLFGDRAMLHAAWDNDELAFLDPFMALAESFVTEIHAKASLSDQKHFVFVIMMMPDEWRIELHQFHHLSVKFSGDVRLVAFRNLGELFGDVDFLHKFSYAA